MVIVVEAPFSVVVVPGVVGVGFVTVEAADVVVVVVVVVEPIEIMLAATLACLCLLGPMSGLRGPAAAM